MDAKNKVFVVIGSIALIATTTVGGYTLFTNKDSVATNTSSTVSNQSTPSSTVASTAAATSTAATSTSTTTDQTAATVNATGYKDGTYTAKSSYSVPEGGQNSISATITISDGKITSISASDSYSDRESSMYVSRFESSVSSDANGQSIADYSPSRIGGASLTTDGFSSVLDTVRSQAQA